MEGYLGSAYLWVKAFHIIFVIFWMAGMFMLPRYFAYHAECEVGSAEDQLWIEREKRLMNIIINPAMIITWVLGICLVLNIGFGAGGWLHAKLLLVFILSGFHGMMSRWRKDLAAGVRKKNSAFFRKMNEVPAIFIILIVILVIVRPF
ncbi:protoporphyrinogen oxidase HemJ [Kordiimonas pumila]|uniref:Protoporphyrinogen IX oxidase n=1 Tax=Kordiimonas pumila TaxID=2161677 RepID=A0ABV7DAN3_9PROT|nr:protoporphyrinogen oxidase HemJ [Kordiimonas pumila]